MDGGSKPAVVRGKRGTAVALAAAAVASAATLASRGGPLAVAAVTLAAAAVLAWWGPRSVQPGARRSAALALMALSLPWSMASVGVAIAHLAPGALVLYLTLRDRLEQPEPAVRAAPPLTQPATQSSPGTSRQGMNVLLVDDNPANRFYGALLLKRMEHRVESVATGEQALEVAQRKRFDVVLMDVRMPGMGGEAAAAALRERIPPHRRPLIVALTADDRPEERQRLLDAGMDAFLPKPLQVEALTEALDGVNASPSRVLTQ